MATLNLVGGFLWWWALAWAYTDFLLSGIDSIRCFPGFSSGGVVQFAAMLFILVC